MIHTLLPAEHPRGTKFTISRINLGGCAALTALPRRNRCANIAVLALSVHTTFAGIRIPYVKLIRTTALSGAYIIGSSYSTQMSDGMLVSFQMDIFIGHRPDANARGMNKR